MPTSPEDQARAMIANLKGKTGKTLDQWLGVVAKCGEQRHGAIVRHLKSDHGMTHGFASLVAHKFLEQRAGGPQAGDDLIAAQYAGAKAGLRPIYDAVIAAVAKCGTHEVAPKKSYVSLRRAKQFAIVQPSTRTRVDLGLNLGEVPASGRLELSGSFNAMVSHRIRLESPADVDKELRDWLRQAWQRAG